MNAPTPKQVALFAGLLGLASDEAMSNRARRSVLPMSISPTARRRKRKSVRRQRRRNEIARESRRRNRTW